MKKTKLNSLINKVDDAFNYFNGFRLEELKEDDKYYINALMSYIEKLEARTKQLKRNELHSLIEQLFDTEAKRSHDKVFGNDYHIINWEGNLIYKHKETGFAPRLRNKAKQLK